MESTPDVFMLDVCVFFNLGYKTNFHVILQSWDSFFRKSSYQRPPSLALPGKNEVPVSTFLPSLSGVPGAPVNEKIIDDHLAVQAIIRSYQVYYNLWIF